MERKREREREREREEFLCAQLLTFEGRKAIITYYNHTTALKRRQGVSIAWSKCQNLFDAKNVRNSNARQKVEKWVPLFRK